ncbi:MAG: hypothetical protein H6Q05_4229 [Acidobacteria bacterium]|nr:hypothetical protein [Acidobacteriota bacterium]
MPIPLPLVHAGLSKAVAFRSRKGIHYVQEEKEVTGGVAISLTAVITTVTREVPRFLAVKLPGPSSPEALDALPFGPFDPERDRTLELGLRRWVREKTGIEIGYVEQLYTFGNRNRDPVERSGGPRVISVAYLALVREVQPSGGSGAAWRDWYQYFPWEDWRRGQPKVVESRIAPALDRWIRSAETREKRRERRERCDIFFGRGGAPWVAERVLDRYELLYEVGLAAEAGRDAGIRSATPPDPDTSGNPHLGQPMAFDHRRILATALGRLRGKLKYRPVVFELLPETFTLLQLQRVVEAMTGIGLHKQNLRRMVESGGLVEATGQIHSQTGGRPAGLFRFRREVLRERPAAGVGIPGLLHG